MKLTDKEVIADNGKFIHRVGSDMYFTCCTLLNGETESSFEEVDSIPQENPRAEEINAQIDELKKKLSDTDYISLKAIEGEDVSQYGNWKEQRSQWRTEINELEQELKGGTK